MPEDNRECNTQAPGNAAPQPWTTNGDVSGFSTELSMNELVIGLPRAADYGHFRDGATNRLAQRYRRREQRRRKLNMLAAALLLASAGFGATMLTMPPTSHASLVSSENARCIKAGQSLEPWFKAELHRRASTGVPRQDDFNLMLAWFRDAQGQCAAGLTQAASENLQALADRIAAREQLRPSADD
jgi:hypothetical protein